MAEKTPVKALPKTTEQPYICRCCNSGFANHPIDLFGAKAESENLLSLIENVTGLKFCDGDGFPRRICRNCFNRLKQFAEFKALCLKSRSHQESFVRLKRGKKETENPSLAQQREVKRGKRDDHDQVEGAESSSRRRLEFALIYPKVKLNEVPQPENESQVGKKGRILPRSIRPVSTPQPSDEGMQILANTGLRNNETTKTFRS
ncbi:uncharacterized protein LOC114948215 isoform X2 [Acropora millepora]|uniref:uncharacterized protein LOC114948215 isoform X2 n=1 Tax=Acropora millepora TaxID=45264 RepID=UPI001CF52101|nr:uncharacterized protein LOC114948215 isoform X2 [Acropora millepora]